LFSRVTFTVLHNILLTFDDALLLLDS